jgi:hypothetical protein
MADVTGSIGNEHVELNNAATEATLKLLLQASLAANKQSLASIQQLAQSSGLNPQAVAAANQGLEQTSSITRKIGKGFEVLGFAAGALSGVFKESVELSKKLASGTGEASDVLASFAKVGGVAGAIIGQFVNLAQAQEKYLQTYQTLSSAGINFGGSLTDMRMAASNVYTTLDGFANLMKNNSEAFAKMGNTADQGARAFLGTAERMQKSEIGQDLRNLGYTADQVNQGLASYISMTGGRNAQEMKNTSGITKAAGEYLTQLDALAVITGKTREEQEQALKRANANAAFEQMKLGMSEEQREAYNRGLAEMSAKFGKAGEDLYISQAMGLPPMTEAAQKLQALAPEVAKASQGMADVGKRGGSAAETMKLSAQAVEGASKAAKRFEGVAGALSFSTDSTSQALMGLLGVSNRASIQGAETAEKGEKQREAIAEEQKKRRQSEAADAQSAQDALKELGNTIMAAFMPIMKALFPIINSVIRGFAEIVGPLFRFASGITANENVMTGLKFAVTGVVAALLAYKAYQIAKNVKSGISGILDRGKDAAAGAIQGFRTGGVRGAIGGLMGGAFGAGGLGKPDGSATNPYYVIVVPGPGGLANALPGAGGGPGGAGGAAGRAAGGLGRFAGLAKGLAGGVGGILGGLALSSASDYAKEKGMEKTGAGLDIASKAASFAGTGAMLGSVVPGLGTVVGGGLGALAGGAYGLYQNFGSLFGNKKPEGKPMTDATENLPPMNTEEIQRQLSQSELDNKKSEKSPMEVMQTEIQMLNKNIAEMLKYTKDMTENTKRTMDGIGKLNPNLFAR